MDSPRYSSDEDHPDDDARSPESVIERLKRIKDLAGHPASVMATHEAIDNAISFMRLYNRHSVRINELKLQMQNLVSDCLARETKIADYVKREHNARRECEAAERKAKEAADKLALVTAAKAKEEVHLRAFYESRLADAQKTAAGVEERIRDQTAVVAAATADIAKFKERHETARAAVDKLAKEMKAMF